MATSEPNADCNYRELKRIYETDCAPFRSLAQVERFIKAATILHGREPAEVEQSGIRVSKRDLQMQIDKAEREREVLLLAGETATVIVPTDCLR